MTDKVNQLIADNPAVKARMVKYAADFFGCSPENVMENCGIAGWPGGWGQVGGGEHQWRDQQGRPNVHFCQVDLTMSYHEREIEQIKGSAEFHRRLVGTDTARTLGLNPDGAERLMEQYEEMKKAFETNTPSRYKTFSEMWLDGYQPLRKTPPGSLVNQTV